VRRRVARVLLVVALAAGAGACSSGSGKAEAPTTTTTEVLRPRSLRFADLPAARAPSHGEDSLPECNPASGAGCTSGRDDEHVATLRNRNARESVRIDDIFLLPTPRCRPNYGPATGLFGDEPATNGPSGIVWISDHTGAAVEFSCG
jgi:hypothetical protein